MEPVMALQAPDLLRSLSPMHGQFALPPGPLLIAAPPLMGAPLGYYPGNWAGSSPMRSSRLRPPSVGPPLRVASPSPPPGGVRWTPARQGSPPARPFSVPTYLGASVEVAAAGSVPGNSSSSTAMAIATPAPPVVPFLAGPLVPPGAAMRHFSPPPSARLGSPAPLPPHMQAGPPMQAVSFAYRGSGGVGEAEMADMPSPAPARRIPLTAVPQLRGGGVAASPGAFLAHTVPLSPARQQPSPRGRPAAPCAMAALGPGFMQASPRSRSSSPLPGPGRPAAPSTAAAFGGGSVDSLTRQLQALQQAKTQAAAQQALSSQQIANRQEELRRETFKALSQSNGLSEVLKRWPAPKQADSQANATSDSGCGNHYASMASLGSSAMAASASQVGYSQSVLAAPLPECYETGGQTEGSASTVQADGRNSQPIMHGATIIRAEQREALQHSAVSLQAAKDAPQLAAASVVVHERRLPNQEARESRPTPHHEQPPAYQTPHPPAEVGAHFEAISCDEDAPSIPAPPVAPTPALSPASTWAARQQPMTPAQEHRPASPRLATPVQRGGSRDGRSRGARTSPGAVTGALSTREQQAEQDRCQEDLLRCAAAVTPKVLRDLRLLQRPPDIVEKVFQATATFLGAVDTRLPVLRKTLFNVGASAGPGLADKLRGVHVDHITFAQFRRVQKLVMLPEFDEEIIRGTCRNAVPLAVWCRRIALCLARTRFQGRPEAVALVNSLQETGSAESADGDDMPDEDELPPPSPPQLMQHASMSSLESPTISQELAQQGNGIRLSASQQAAVTAAEAARAAAAAVEKHTASRRLAAAEAEATDGRDGGGAAHASRQAPEVGGRAKWGNLYVSPDITRLDADQLRQVRELEVSRPEVGSIVFHDVTDCTNLDIPTLVHLDVGEVLVYPVPGTKPAVGEGLNKRATVTMQQCWPPNGRKHLEEPGAQDRYVAKIRQMTEDKRAKFIDYDCKAGIWKFQVEHF
eukprot:TRINITY_DN111066_c0_g1_i1.p1 TRINITY_DN111066_c0_g1~~TRINITY_DN111066_c0_g1_i1.p1  ORF type:complete len:1019 (+),score=210.36 TRINITY_DN111066_c0_g1_i1:119-3058(+)